MQVVRQRAICLNSGRKRPAVPTRDVLVAEFKHWSKDRTGDVTARVLLGQFYVRYKAKYRLYPLGDLQDDLVNMDSLLTHLSEDIALAPWIVEFFFSLKSFHNLSTRTFSNRNVLAGWCAIERAQKLRSGTGHGEQAEFTPAATSKGYGTIRI